MVHQLALKVHNTGPSNSPTGVFPPVIGTTLQSLDPTSIVETLQCRRADRYCYQCFLSEYGHQRARCATCHEPRTVGCERVVDSASLPAQRRHRPDFPRGGRRHLYSDDVSTLAKKRQAYSLLLSQGLIQIFCPCPTSAGIYSPGAPGLRNHLGQRSLRLYRFVFGPPVVSVYRRPLPSANLRFLTECPPSRDLMRAVGDHVGRKRGVAGSRATDTTLGHAQAPNPPKTAQLKQIVNFESAVYDAQAYDVRPCCCNSEGATGGPVALSQQNFFIGINDALSAGFDAVVFTLYDAWENLPNRARDSVARGETIFNTRQFTIIGVNGLNLFSSDPLGVNDVTGTCTTCHDSPNVGNHSMKLALNIGVADATPPVLDVSRFRFSQWAAPAG